MQDASSLAMCNVKKAISLCTKVIKYEFCNPRNYMNEIDESLYRDRNMRGKFWVTTFPLLELVTLQNPIDKGIPRFSKFSLHQVESK